MAVVTTDFLAALFTGYRAIFLESFPAASMAQDWRKIATIFPSATDKETYAWLGTVPKMTEWLDERVPRGLLPHDYSITNRHYEASLEVDRDTIEDDKFALINPRVMQLADEAARFPNELVMELLETNPNAFDALAFFADTRVIGGSANIDNLLSGAYSGSSSEIRTAISAAAVAARKFQDDRGRPMNIVLDTIVCPPDLEMDIKNALLPGVAGTTRPEATYIKDIIVTPHLTSAVNWYLLATGYPLKPIFFQNRKDAEFTALDQATGHEVFMRKKFFYGVDARYNVGVGDPRFAIKIVDA